MYPFKDERCFVQNAWYVAAWSDEVKRDVLGRRILDIPLVFYRTEAGDPVALQGVCPHKYHPLAGAALRNDEITCPYHGFRFDASGACAGIPSQDTPPDNCRLRSYPVAERWKWIWVWMGDPERADETLLPDHDALGLSDAWDARIGACLEIGARYQVLNDNLLDLTHIGYLHAHRTSPEYATGMSTKPPELVVDPAGHRQSNVHKLTLKNYHTPVPGVAEMDEVDVNLTIDFYPPCFHVGRIEFCEPVNSERNGAHIGELHMFHAMTPITRHSTYYFFATARDFAAPEDTVDQLVANQVGILDDDKAAAEAIEAVLATTSLSPEVIVAADAGMIRARRWVQRMIDAESVVPA